MRFKKHHIEEINNQDTTLNNEKNEKAEGKIKIQALQSLKTKVIIEKNLKILTD